MSKLVPPDGGWGWIIVMSYALNSFVMIPVIQGSGLVFKDLFPLLNINSTQGSTIISVNMAFGMILGLINGPLLQHFGYRKMAIVGSLLYFFGITFTAFSRTVTLIIITYGLIASVGLTIAGSSFSLALNSYFTTKRGRATGWAITMMGLGSIFMPHVTTILLDNYGPQGTLLILGSYSLHSILASLMLHPLKWHMKRLPSVEDNDKHVIEITEKESHVDTDKPNEVSEDDDSFHDAPLMEEHQRHRRLTVSSINHDVEGVSIYGFETPLSRQISETARTISREMSLDGWLWNNNELNNKTIFQPNHYWWNSNKSVNSINLSSSLQIFNEDSVYQPLRKNKSFNSTSKISKAKSCQSIPENDCIVENKNDKTTYDTKVDNQNDDICEISKQKSVFKRILRRIVAFYGLDILRDGIYVNIMLGMSIAIFAEINFSLLTPFILADRNLTTNQIAITMSVIATADLVFRSIAPYIGEWLRLTPRPMYAISLIFLIISRTGLIFTETLTEVIIVAVGLGVAKGIRSVYMTLVIPSYVPIKNLHYASAIQMTVNGVIMLSAGPILGVIRDAVGSYTPCIIIINSMSALTITIWLTELIILRRTKLGSKKLQQDLNEEKT